MSRASGFLGKCLAIALLLGLGLAGASAATDEPRRVAIVRLDFEGNVSELGKLTLSDRVVGSLVAAGFQVFAGKAVSEAIKRDPALESCQRPECRAKAAQVLGADYLVVGKVAVKQKNYEITFDLLDGQGGRSVGRSRERCELCGIQEAGGMIDRAASSLRASLNAMRLAPARLTVQSKPLGAFVTLDGRALGATPVTVDVASGKHEIGLSAEGHVARREMIESKGGSAEIINIELTAGGPIPSSDWRPPSAWRNAAWVGVAVGTASVLGGLIALAQNGNAVPCAQVDHTGCHRDTGILAGALLGVGLTAAATGAVVLYVTPVRPAGGGGVAALATSWVVSAQRSF